MNNKFNSKLNTFLLVLLFSSLCFSQNSPKNKYEIAIAYSHHIIDSLRIAQKVPGIDMAVSIDGITVWAEGFGYADLEHQKPVEAGKTRFRIGSVSKPLTAAALGRLLDKDKIDLSAPVQTYVPYFPVKRHPITVKQIGGHIAGIRHYKGTEVYIKDRYNSVKSALTIFQDDSLLFVPGSKFSYSSYGFNLLSAVIEGASGESFLPFIQREVFDPLGMTSTSPDKNDSIIVNRTSFYDLDPQKNIINAPYVDNSYKWAGGGFISTTTDLIKFAQAHLKPGFLSANTLKELTTSQVLSNRKNSNYGIGWFTFSNSGLQGFSHSGGSVGGITNLVVYPKENLIIVFLSNSSVANYGLALDNIVKKFLEIKNK